MISYGNAVERLKSVLPNMSSGRPSGRTKHGDIKETEKAQLGNERLVPEKDISKDDWSWVSKSRVQLNVIMIYTYISVLITLKSCVGLLGSDSVLN